jgi:two-component system sensor histidine kinase QseC
VWDQALPDGSPGRALGLAVTAHAKDVVLPPGTEPLRLTLVVAASRAGLDATLAGLTWVLVLTDALALGVLALLVAGGVRRGLRPVDALAGEVARLDATSLARRVDTTALPDELVPLALKLNELLARLEAAFARERRMTAAVAHELRTPIAELRAATDVARRWPEDADVSGEAVAIAGDVARRMGEAVDAVLRFCRLESGQEAATREPVPLRALLDELWAPHARRATERGLVLRNEVPGDLAAEGDRGLLALALGNLLDNACSFAAPGSVCASAGVREGQVELRVANPAPDLHAADLAHLAEPFWRKDAARSDGRHAGLGLALVTSVVRVLGGRLEFALEGGEFAVTLRLPRAVAPDPTPGPVMSPSPSPARAR